MGGMEGVKLTGAPLHGVAAELNFLVFPAGVLQESIYSDDRLFGLYLLDWLS